MTTKQPNRQRQKPTIDYRQVALSKLTSAEVVSEYRFHPTRMWRFDYALPFFRIAIEVEGGVWTRGRHTRPKGFLGDVEKYNTAATMGWHVLRATPESLLTHTFIETIKQTITNICKMNNTQNLKINFTLAEGAIAPTRAHATDAGFDLYVLTAQGDTESNIMTYDTGVSVAIPNGYVGLVFSRSSIYKTGQAQCNGVGVIDSGYTGTIKFKTYLADNNVNAPIAYKVGERCCQLVIVPIPDVEYELIDTLPTSDRDTGGFGSTGK